MARDVDNIFLQQETNEPEFIDSFLSNTQSIPVSTFEAAEATFELSSLDTLSKVIDRTREIGEQKREASESGAPFLSPQELNEMFRDEVEIPFKDALPLSVVTTILDRQKKRRELQDKISRGPKKWTSTVTNFGAGLLAHATDPLELGAGLATDGLLSAALIGSRAGRAIGIGVKNATLMQRSLRIGGEGIVANLAIEPLILKANAEDLADYTIEDSLTSVIGGAIGFAGVRYAGGKAFHFASGKSPRFNKILHQVSLGRLEVGKSIDVDPIYRDAIGEADSRGFDKQFGFDYEFGKIGVSDVPVKRFFAPRDRQKQFKVVHNDYGDGVYLTDSPDHANASASTKYDSKAGSVEEFSIPELKLYELESPLTKPLANGIEGVAGKISDINNKSAREVLDDVVNKIEDGDLGEEAMNAVQQVFKSNGFEGYKHEGGGIMGVRQSPQNVVVVFDSNNLKSTGSVLKANRNLLKQSNMKEINDLRSKYQDPKSELFHDVEGDEIYQGTVNKSEQSIVSVKLDEAETRSIETLRGLDQQGVLTPEMKTQIKNIDAAKRDHDAQEKLVSAARDCVAGV